MAETQINRRTSDTAKTVGNYSGFTGLAVATIDYLWQCKVAGGWIEPNTTLIIFWSTAIAPTIMLIQKIINNRLKKLAGEDSYE